MMAGGFGGAKEVDTEFKDWVTGFKGAAETKSGETFEKFDALKYKSQVVAGTNYWVKVEVGSGKCAHVKILKPLPHTNEPGQVTEVQVGKTLEDEL
mmetsp:Transcript_27141/g.31312  ORF Transcript_27141/g.31312 Transcript_27141/m.31312 type:complete len:96 (+) Transcript_27141:36-323(+)